MGFKLTERLVPRMRKSAGSSMGILFRVAAMSLANIIVLPAFYGVPQSVAYGMLPLIALFNIAQGAITVLLGIFLDEAVRKRFPTPRP